MPGDTWGRDRAVAKRRAAARSPQGVLNTKGFLAAERVRRQAELDHNASVAAHASALNQVRAVPAGRVKTGSKTDARLSMLGAKASGFLGSPIPHTGHWVPPIVNRFVKGASDTATYLPASLYALRPGQTKGTVKAMAQGTLDQANRLAYHPLREASHDPWGTFTLGLSAVSGGASVAGRASAIGRSLGAEEGGAAALRAGLKKPGGGTRTIYHPVTKEPTMALNYETPLGPLIGGAYDRALGLREGSSPLTALHRRAAAHKWTSEQAQNQRAIDNIRFGMAGAPDINPGKHGRIREVGRTVNKASRFGILYTKPLGYIAGNLPGQVLLGGMQQGVHLPGNMAKGAMLRDTRLGRVLNKASGSRVTPLTKDSRTGFMGLAGGGRMFSSMAPKGVSPIHTLSRGVTKVDEAAGRAFGKILDDPWRASAAVHELRKQGVGTNSIEQALQDARQAAAQSPGLASAAHPHQLSFDSPNPAASASLKKAVVASRRSNRAMIDYGRMSENERILRDYLFLYPWVKGSTAYSLQFPLQHPYATTAFTQMSNEGKKRTGLPKQVGFARGSFKVGERTMPGLGKVPIVVNPRNAGIFTQTPDTVSKLAALLPSVTGIHPSKFNDPSEITLPLYSAILSAKQSDRTIGGIAKKVIGQAAAATLVSRVAHPPSENNPQGRLYPRTARDSWEAWLLGSMARHPQNPVKMEDMRRQEKLVGKGPVAKAALQEQWTRTDLLHKLNLINGSHAQHLDPSIASLASDTTRMVKEQQALLHYPEFKDKTHPTKLNAKGQFIAAVATMIPDGPQRDIQIAALVDQFKGLPDVALPKQSVATIKALRQLVRAYNGATASLPYTEGGAPMRTP